MNHRAFTLIELLVVVAIIGILAAVGVVAYNGYTGAAKIAVAKQNFKVVTSLIKSEYIKCETDSSAKWMNYGTCSAATKPAKANMFNNWRNTHDLAKKVWPNMENPYGRVHPFTKSTHPVGCCGSWTEIGEINIQVTNWSGVSGLFIQSAAAPFREGTNNKLVCHPSASAPEKDPNCLREWIPDY